MAEPTDQEIYERACELYLDADGSIDVLTVSVDKHPDGDGAWVSALVWVPLPMPLGAERVISDDIAAAEQLDDGRQHVSAVTIWGDINDAHKRGELTVNKARELKERVLVTLLGLAPSELRA